MQQRKKIKCVVWDLDNTLWQGTLLEDANVVLNQHAVTAIRELDRRGILNSIASKNEHHIAMEKLKALGMAEYFLYPQIHWNPKHSSIENIAESINIGIDTLAFVDDQIFEREEVNHYHPEVLCIDANDIERLVSMPEMTPDFITPDSALRRKMYQDDIKRQEVKDVFDGSEQDFLASLNMKFSISKATLQDLQRAEELTVRTNQLNTTGYTYSYDELKSFIDSDDHILLVASLKDKYGSYGKIGITLIERNEKAWTIKLLLMSCRVMSRGVGNVMINYLMQQAKKNHVDLLSYFIPTDRNRMMYMTYKFSGFKEYKKQNELVILKNDLNHIRPMPDFIDIHAEQLMIIESAY